METYSASPIAAAYVPTTASLSDTFCMADAQAPSLAPPGTTPDQSSSDRPLRELRGVVERITYQNAENGFTVARLAPERPESEAEGPPLVWRAASALRAPSGRRARGA